MVGAIALAPPAILEAGSRILNPTVLALGVAVGLLSSVIPYSFELMALRRIPATGVQHFDESRAGRRGTCRDDRARRVPDTDPVARHGVCGVASIGATRTSTTLDLPAPD